MRPRVVTVESVATMIPLTVTHGHLLHPETTPNDSAIVSLDPSVRPGSSGTREGMVGASSGPISRRRHCVWRSPPGQDVADALARQARHAGAGRDSCTADVRKQRGPRRSKQPGIHRRFPVEDVEPGGVDRARLRARRPSAFSSTTGPRAVLTSTAVGFMTASSAAPMRWRVDSVSGTCRLTMSERSSNSSSVGTKPGRPVSCRVVWMTSMSKPTARWATARAIRPNPTRPRVAPCTSRARWSPKPQPVQRPSRRSRSASVDRRVAGEDEEEGQVGRRVIEHAGRVADRDPQRMGRDDVDVVVADGRVGHDAELARRARRRARPRRCDR